ncbi:hypothetical protein B0H16DRAFT_1452974 [Mycena metata]|uniref:Uncharacterized protein n=1 Tax=Mycena metata TaxID=1033252 RepID=A0AAD7JMR3_9AGAR|nr:hypothetical protein B0H16DRAFT_1452974 [Mycena metata]
MHPVITEATPAPGYLVEAFPDREAKDRPTLVWYNKGEHRELQISSRSSRGAGSDFVPPDMEIKDRRAEKQAGKEGSPHPEVPGAKPSSVVSRPASPVAPPVTLSYWGLPSASHGILAPEISYKTAEEFFTPVSSTSGRPNVTATPGRQLPPSLQYNAARGFQGVYPYGPEMDSASRGLTKIPTYAPNIPSMPNPSYAQWQPQNPPAPRAPYVNLPVFQDPRRKHLLHMQAKPTTAPELARPASLAHSRPLPTPPSIHAYSDVPLADPSAFNLNPRIGDDHSKRGRWDTPRRPDRGVPSGYYAPRDTPGERENPPVRPSPNMDREGCTPPLPPHRPGYPHPGDRGDEEHRDAQEGNGGPSRGHGGDPNRGHGGGPGGGHGGGPGGGHGGGHGRGHGGGPGSGHSGGHGGGPGPGGGGHGGGHGPSGGDPNGGAGGGAGLMSFVS